MKKFNVDVSARMSRAFVVEVPDEWDAADAEEFVARLHCDGLLPWDDSCIEGVEWTDSELIPRRRHKSWPTDYVAFDPASTDPAYPLSRKFAAVCRSVRCGFAVHLAVSKCLPGLRRSPLAEEMESALAENRDAFVATALRCVHDTEKRAALKRAFKEEGWL